MRCAGEAANVPNFLTTPPHHAHRADVHQTPARRPKHHAWAVLSRLHTRPHSAAGTRHQTCLRYSKAPSTLRACGTHANHALPRLPRPRPLNAALMPLQILKARRKKNVKKGIQFCLMVCGASGTGTRPCLHPVQGRRANTPVTRPDDVRQHALRQAGA